MGLVRIVALTFACIVVAMARAKASDASARADVRGDVVGFFPYANATLVAANGHAELRIGTRTIAADAIRYDLTAKRLVASGDVRVSGRGDTLEGAAYRLDLESDRAYLVRVDPLPTTLELHGDDARSAVEGPAPPGTFDQIDLDGQRPYIRSRRAIVVPGAGVRMSPAEFPTSAGPALVLPTFLYTLVTNANIAQTAGPGASFDQPYNLFGSPGSLTAAHLRYESQNGVTGALDTRLVDRDRAYAVASIVPLRDRRADLIAFQQLRPGVQQTFGAAHSFSLASTTSLTYRLQATNRRATATLSANDYDAFNRIELGLATIPHDVGHALSYQLRTAYGRDHDLYGFPFANAFHTTLGAYVASPGITLAGTDLSARYDYRETAYDYARQTTSGSLSLTGGRRFPRGVSLFARVVFDQENNRYRDVATARRALALPDPERPYLAPDGTLFPGFFAYAGLNTYRTYELVTTFSGRSNEDRMQITLAHSRDFPQSFGYGRPPLTASVDITRRLTRTIRLEIGRSYAFGWNGRYLSPQYTFAVSP